MSKLLLLSCSQAKRLFPSEPLPAIERYTGVLFQVLKKWRREHQQAPGPDVLIISARFGLLSPETPIPYYDQRITAEQAKILAPTVRVALQRQLSARRYSNIFVNLGRDYLPVLDDLLGLQTAEWARGPIGIRARQLKTWLSETMD